MGKLISIRIWQEGNTDWVPVWTTPARVWAMALNAAEWPQWFKVEVL